MECFNLSFAKHSARWISWFADVKYLEGFAHVLQICKFLIEFVTWLLAGKLVLTLERSLICQ
jgi:hypothetical protein